MGVEPVQRRKPKRRSQEKGEDTLKDAFGTGHGKSEVVEVNPGKPGLGCAQQ